MTLADMVEQLERGRIGHSEAMRWLGVDSYAALVEIVHANGFGRQRLRDGFACRTQGIGRVLNEVSDAGRRIPGVRWLDQMRERSPAPA